MTSVILVSIAAVAVVVSWFADRRKTVEALRLAWRSFAALLPTLAAMVGIIGLVLAVVSPRVIAGLFAVGGLPGFVLVSLVGSVLTMPAPVAFPLAGSLLKLGAGLPALAAFITTLTMVGIVTAPVEIAHFGRRFTIVRQSLSFLLAVLIGALMGVIRL